MFANFFIFIAGMKGEQGEMGPFEIEKINVTKGNRGEDGFPGSKGEPGIKGFPGKSVHVHVFIFQACFTCSTHSQTTNFRPFQIERICRQRFQFDENNRVLQTDRKHFGKRRNRLLRAISPFLHSVFKRLVQQTHENQGLFWKGLTHYHTMPHFDTLKIHSCGKHREKRRNCL